MECSCSRNQNQSKINSISNINSLYQSPEELYLSLQNEENSFNSAENSHCIISKIKLDQNFFQKEIEFYDQNYSENIETKSALSITRKIVKHPKSSKQPIKKKYLGKNFPIVFGNSIINILMLKCNCITKD